MPEWTSAYGEPSLSAPSDVIKGQKSAHTQKTDQLVGFSFSHTADHIHRHTRALARRNPPHVEWETKKVNEDFEREYRLQPRVIYFRSERAPVLSLSAENAAALAADGDCDSFCDTRTGSGRTAKSRWIWGNWCCCCIVQSGGAFLIYSRAGTLAPDSRRVICFDN